MLVAAAAMGGAYITGRVHTTIGPFHADVRVRPALVGDTVVDIGPLGSISLDTHDGPLGLVVEAREIRLDAARQLVDNPESLADVDRRAADDVQRALGVVALRALLGGMAAAVGVVVLRRFTPRRAFAAAAIGAVTVTAAFTIARVSLDETAIAEPRYTGLLRVAPRAVGSLEAVRARFDVYREQVSSLVANLTTIYNAASDLPTLSNGEDTIKILHVSDLHLNPEGFDLVAELVRQFKVDAVFDTGDINDWGTSFEAPFAERISNLKVPYVFVRGNHDSSATAASVAAQPNAIVLDGAVRDVAGIRVFGIGDPRFTPDKTDAVSIEEERAQATAFAPEVAHKVVSASPLDVVMLHDPRAAVDLGGGSVHLVLAGHLHKPSSRNLDGTLLLVEGSTGGAGLRGLEGDNPVPFTATVLYLGAVDHRLHAYDRVTVAGIGGAGARIERHLVDGGTG